MKNGLDNGYNKNSFLNINSQLKSFQCYIALIIFLIKYS